MLARIVCLLLMLNYGSAVEQETSAFRTKGELSPLPDAPTSENVRVTRGLRNRGPFRPPGGPPLNRGQHLAQRPPSSPSSADHGPFPELYLRQNLRHGDTVVVEEVQQPVPFNVTDNGDRIIKDQPMVERRSIPQFGGMVTLYTRTNPIRLLYYGNWCGSGGMGDTLDGIDHCCMDHDMCYGEVEKFPCNLPLQKPYVVHYAWRWDDKRKQAYCLRTGDRCGDRTCECDRVAAACFSQYMIDGKLEWNRLRKNRVIKGTKRPYVDDLHINYRH